ncbi:hypothetical protein MCOR25_004713 [Pyricularia grisea]|nr:hypothetical protein MCOR25_004713 [Pyricularia grisea]
MMDFVFALGSNGSGQLGIGHKEDISVPKPALFSSAAGELSAHPTSPIVKVAAGGNHTLLLTEDGEIYSSGDPASGACGLKSAAADSAEAGRQRPPVFHKIHVPTEQAAQSPGRLIAATWEASIITGPDEQGRRNRRVYSFGCGSKGELGQGPLIIRIPFAQPIADFPPPDNEVVDLSACMGHVVAVLSNGDAYGWGNGRKGQLGAPEGIVTEPHKIEGVPFKVVKAACGKEFSCLVGEPGSGDIAVIGLDKWSVRSSAPTSVPGWRDVQASWGNIYILQADRSVLSWGRNDHGQLAPSGLPKMSQIAVGSEHVVAIDEALETVAAWGWGEHGNCGPQVQGDNSQGKTGWTVIASAKHIPPGSSITAIGAGCATSWIMIGKPAS